MSMISTMTTSASLSIEEVAAESLDGVPIERRDWDIDESDNIYETIEMKTAIKNKKNNILDRRGSIIFKVIGLCLVILIMSLLVHAVNKMQYLEEQALLRNLKYDALKAQVNINSMNYNHLGKAYLPFGPQTDVPVSTVTNGGWTNCYSRTYIDMYEATSWETVVNVFCSAPYWLLGCKRNNSQNFTILAWAQRQNVLFTSVNFHNAHGTSWYYNNSSALGFAEQGYKSNHTNYGTYSGTRLKNNCKDLMEVSSKRLCLAFTRKSSRNYEPYITTGGVCGNETMLSTYGYAWEILIFGREAV